MANEIERKFLVKGRAWRSLVKKSYLIRQGYVPTANGTAIRIRLAGRGAYLTLKGRSNGPVRSEFEYRVPLADARAMLGQLCSTQIVEKRRHLIPIPGTGLTWEIDVFFGANAPLVVAEIELPAESTPFPRPPWLGEEVTDDHRYKNNHLAENPYGMWKGK